MRGAALTTVLSFAFLAAFTPAARAEGDGPRALMDRGRMRDAAAAADARLRSAPDDLEALCVLSRLRARQQRYDEATRLAEHAVATSPKSADAHYALAEVSGTQAQHAGVFKQMSLGRRFKKEDDAALALDPHHVDAMEAMIEFYTSAPGMLGGDRQKAAALTEELVKVNPTEGWLQKAQNAFAAKDSISGETCLRKAAELGGGDAKLALANRLAQPWRKPDEAERLARDVATAEPWRTGAWSVLAMRDAMAKRWPELDATLAESEKAVPGNLGPHYQAARVLITSGGEPARAEALLRRYLSVEPEIGQPSWAAAHWRLGLALEQEGKKADARAEVETALKLDPSLDAAKKDLERLGH
ncbi:MAG TPA: tetratricopeptide repeat protein [Candidatus Saccharimonadaceae bacterium]|jgi:tetratricopeptide (TPR) repeat protein|nr:tetratricopeptide repeat protein [Candidatus Saccharimonadaceae bacterium]